MTRKAVQQYSLSALVATLLLWSGPAVPDIAEERIPAFDIADKVLVRKSMRKLYLLKNGRVINHYDIRLGLSPQGDKLREGDFRTPEGLYRLDGRISDSEFFMAIHISYPNADDQRAAAEQELNPGGNIMIHGMPNELKQPLEYYRARDWTNGCIAVSNSDLVEIWLQTPADTVIEIVP